jgi:23S rRNA pseudouridine2605 synthase
VKKERLSKVLAKAGIASRRASELIIQEGRVTVNKEKALLPQTMVDPLVDTIMVDGERLPRAQPHVYYAVNKPFGFLCTNDPHVKKRLIDLIEDSEGKRLYTIGRLDKETTGLILVTNDGHFAHQIMHPSHRIEKEYIAKVDQEINHEHLVRIQKGCFVEGSFVRPKDVSKIRRGTIRIVVLDGKKHEVRELLAKAHLEVLELTRVRIGGLSLGKLPPGASKKLKETDLENITGKKKTEKSIQGEIIPE